jgi:hypothetical protein
MERTHLREGTLGENTGIKRSVHDVWTQMMDQKQMAERVRPRQETHINKQVLPQAPSPTMTSFLRSSAAMVAAGGRAVMEGVGWWFGDDAAAG